LVLFDSHQLGTAMPRGGHPPHQIQALDRTKPGLAMKPGRLGTMTHGYMRHGTTTLFTTLNVLEGTVIGQCMQRHRHQELIRFLNAIERRDRLCRAPAVWVRRTSRPAHRSDRKHVIRDVARQFNFELTISRILGMVALIGTWAIPSRCHDGSPP
jgi:hypothetical protein